MSVNATRVLIVDDDSQFRRVLAMALNSRGYQVIHAGDGTEALAAVAAESPSLVILDWQMPRMDGIQTCHALRKNFDVPVIMVSGNRSNTKTVALAAGANDYLAKPFSLTELLASIESSLSSHT